MKARAVWLRNQRSHQQRICGVITGPLSRFSDASQEVHWRTAPGPGYSYVYGTGYGVESSRYG
jgi:hypothetical protein